MKSINWSDHFLNFLAVILGVSLAFFVNDRAETKKREQEYAQIVSSFLDELKADKDTYLNYQIPDNSEQLEAIAEVLQLIGSGKDDSLVQKFSRAISINNYNPSGVTFKSLQSTGKLDLIDDFQLRKRISNYYTIVAEESKARGQLQVDFYMDQLLPWILDNTDFNRPDVKALQNTKLYNILIIYRSFVANKVEHYEWMLQEIEALEQQLSNLKVNS